MRICDCHFRIVHPHQPVNTFRGSFYSDTPTSFERTIARRRQLNPFQDRIANSDRNERDRDCIFPHRSGETHSAGLSENLPGANLIPSRPDCCRTSTNNQKPSSKPKRFATLIFAGGEKNFLDSPRPTLLVLLHQHSGIERLTHPPSRSPTRSVEESVEDLAELKSEENLAGVGLRSPPEG